VYCTQRPYIFPGTIKENIKIGNPAATEDQIIEAATSAGIFAFSDNFYETTIDNSIDPSKSGTPSPAPSPRGLGERTRSSNMIQKILDQPTHVRGINLSGGFAQSVALARVFLRPNVKLVILDEAMGMMDIIKKRETVLPNLLNFTNKYNIALLIISHDMQVINMMDYIFLLENSKIIQGSPKDLLTKRKSQYSKLMENMTIDAIKDQQGENNNFYNSNTQ